MPLLKRLGEPAFLPSDRLQELLKPAYAEISRKAIEAAFEEGTPGDENTSQVG
jgi:hypothetical protein